MVHVLRPGLVKSFDQYWEKTIARTLRCDREAFSASRIDLVWDLYFSDSLKDFVRVGRGTGTRRQVLASSPVPIKEWQDFLKNDDNKKQLFRFLAYCALSKPLGCLVVTNMDDTIVSSAAQNIQSPGTSLSGLHCGGMEEADGRLFLHLQDAVENGHTTAAIRTVDTDVFALAISYYFQLKREGLTELWTTLGVGDKTRHIPCHIIATKMGERRSVALRGFHAFSGCDLTSGFRGKKKKSAWNTWELYKEATEAFYILSFPASKSTLEENVFPVLEKFAILMYGGDLGMTSIDDARLALFTSKQKQLHELPPTANALQQHILRCSYQAGYVWGQATVRNPVIPSPQGWGWTKDEKQQWVPVWTTIPPIWEACRQYLVKCGCKKGCGGLCSCRKAGQGVFCTIFCSHCHGDCSNKQRAGVSYR